MQHRLGHEALRADQVLRRQGEQQGARRGPGPAGGRPQPDVDDRDRQQRQHGRGNAQRGRRLVPEARGDRQADEAQAGRQPAVLEEDGIAQRREVARPQQDGVPQGIVAVHHLVPGGEQGVAGQPEGRKPGHRQNTGQQDEMQEQACPIPGCVGATVQRVHEYRLSAIIIIVECIRVVNAGLGDRLPERMRIPGRKFCQRWCPRSGIAIPRRSTAATALRMPGRSGG